MKAVILAAGFGSRLMPLTQDKPKCMVLYKERRIIDYIMQALLESGVKEVCIVGGYKMNVLQEYVRATYKDTKCQIRFHENKEYDTTNMVSTLFCAKEFLQEAGKQKEDILLSYADIVYFCDVVQKLKQSKYDISIAIDRKWRDLWSMRFSDPLSDAETLKLQRQRIIELGKKPKDYSEIEGQYMGLFKISHSFLETFIHFYENLDKNALYDSKDYKNMYMTSFLQLLIDAYHNVYMVETFGNWCEIDCKSDLEIEYIRG